MNCYQLPKFLLNSPYEKLSGSAKIFYAVVYSYFLYILERSESNLDEGKPCIPIRNEKGFFVETTLDKLGFIMGRSEITIRKCLIDCELAGLIHRVYLGGGMVRIYLIYAKEPPKKQK